MKQASDLKGLAGIYHPTHPSSSPFLSVHPTAFLLLLFHFHPPPTTNLLALSSLQNLAEKAMDMFQSAGHSTQLYNRESARACLGVGCHFPLFCSFHTTSSWQPPYPHFSLLPSLFPTYQPIYLLSYLHLIFDSFYYLFPLLITRVFHPYQCLWFLNPLPVHF